MDLFSRSWAALRTAVAALPDEDFAKPSGCIGWLVRDLVCNRHFGLLRLTGMGARRRTAWIGVTCVSGLVLAGCASATGTAPDQDADHPVQVKLTRSGGFAPVHQEVRVEPSGAWIFTDEGRSERGRLSPRESRELQRLATRVSRDGVTGRGLGSASCPDGFRFALTAGKTTLAWTQCAQTSATLDALLRRLLRDTPM